MRPEDKINRRDTSHWQLRDTIHALSSLIPGSAEYFIEYTDSPDRYLLSEDSSTPVIGWRRLYRLIAFPAPQYYILSCDYFDEETYLICRGSEVTLHSNWRYVEQLDAVE